jgi:hypothetical protein
LGGLPLQVLWRPFPPPLEDFLPPVWSLLVSSSPLFLFPHLCSPDQLSASFTPAQYTLLSYSPQCQIFSGKAAPTRTTHLQDYSSTNKFEHAPTSSEATVAVLWLVYSEPRSLRFYVMLVFLQLFFGSVYGLCLAICAQV